MVGGNTGCPPIKNMQQELNREIQVLMKELRGISNKAKSDTQRILSKAGKPLVAALYSAAPHGKKVHKRYSTVKLVKGIRARKGGGNVVATYAPGNLAASFTILKFKGKEFSVTVGAKLAKGAAAGNFGPFGKQDGYYAHMVEKGTKNTAKRPFVAPTWMRMRDGVKNRIILELKKKIKRLK